MRQHMESLGRIGEFYAPQLSHWPEEAIALCEAFIKDHKGSGPMTVVGSSLGGYYATHLAETHNLKAVLINPAVRPYALLAPYLGPQRNQYTDEEYELTSRHIAQLEALEVGGITPQRYLLLVQTGDELLEYRDALARYHGARQVVIEGGNHGFQDFEQQLELIMAFADGGG